MFAQTLLIAGLVLGAPPEPSGPRLEKGLEVRWAGTFTEANFRPGVRAVRNYDVDTRLFVLDTGDYGADAVLFTPRLPEARTQEHRAARRRRSPRHGADRSAGPACRCCPRRPIRTTQDAKAAAVAARSNFKALPTHEAGMFVEHPDKPLKTGADLGSRGNRPTDDQLESRRRR